MDRRTFLRKMIEVSAGFTAFNQVLRPTFSSEPATLESYFNSNRRVYNATYARYDGPTKEQFLRYLQELDSTGTLKVPAPECLKDGICSERLFQLKPEEKTTYLAAKSAHKVWVDKTRQVDWRLEALPDAGLTLLFDPNYIFEKNKFRNNVPIDYDPSFTFDFTKPSIKRTKEETLLALLDSVRSFKHIIHGRDDDRDTSLAFALKEKISRQGCHTMASMVSDLALSLNIPAYSYFSYRDNNWFSWGHASVVFPDIGMIPHGDSVYSYSKVKTRNLVIPWKYFLENIFPKEKAVEKNPGSYDLHYRRNGEAICLAEKLDLSILP